MIIGEIDSQDGWYSWLWITHPYALSDKISDNYILTIITHRIDSFNNVEFESERLRYRQIAPEIDK